MIISVLSSPMRTLLRAHASDVKESLQKPMTAHTFTGRAHHPTTSPTQAIPDASQPSSGAARQIVAEAHGKPQRRARAPVAEHRLAV